MKLQNIILAILIAVTVCIQWMTVSVMYKDQPAKEVYKRDTIKVKDNRMIDKYRKQIKEDAQYINHLEKNYDKCRQMLVGDTTSTR